jgi:hypothetical protein
VHRLRDGASLAALIGDFGLRDHSVGLAVWSWLVMRLTTVDELTTVPLLRFFSRLARPYAIATLLTGVTETPIGMTSWEARCREWFGAPVFADSRIVVFAVS